MTAVRGDAARRLMARDRDQHVGNGPVVAWTAGMVVPADLHGCRAVRSFVREQLDRNHLADRCDDTTLVASELVTNALLHGLAPVLLSLSHLGYGRLSVEVSDAAPPSRALEAASDSSRATRPDRGPSAQQELIEAETGRGLEIVRLLASSWGVRVYARGKCVWALLEQDPS